MNPKVVVMDLGSTIIDNYEINFKRGFKYIYDNYCLHDVSFEDFIIDMDSIYINSFQKRDNDDFEINFHNYLRYMSNVVGFKEDVDYEIISNDKNTSIKIKNDSIRSLRVNDKEIYVYDNDQINKILIIICISSTVFITIFLVTTIILKQIKSRNANRI